MIIKRKIINKEEELPSERSLSVINIIKIYIEKEREPDFRQKKMMMINDEMRYNIEIVIFKKLG